MKRTIGLFRQLYYAGFVIRQPCSAPESLDNQKCPSTGRGKVQPHPPAQPLPGPLDLKGKVYLPKFLGHFIHQLISFLMGLRATAQQSSGKPSETTTNLAPAARPCKFTAQKLLPAPQGRKREGRGMFPPGSHAYQGRSPGPNRSGNSSQLCSAFEVSIGRGIAWPTAADSSPSEHNVPFTAPLSNLNAGCVTQPHFIGRVKGGI